MKTTIYSTILGLTFSAITLATNANAADSDIILFDAIDDYSHDVTTTHQNLTRDSRVPKYRGSGYLVEIVLDEAYHDYQSTDTESISRKQSDLPQAEFAAMEQSLDLPSSLEIYD